MENGKQTDFPVNSIRLCIDSIENGIYKGRIAGVAIEDEIEFEGITEFVIKIDDAFNKIGQPQSCQVLRSFGETKEYNSYVGTPKHYHTSEEISSKRGAIKTAELTMLSRHRAEWQGNMRDVDTDETKEFQTILDCVRFVEKK